jgi:hypothetical protein
MADQRMILVVVVGAIAAIGLGLLVILLPMSFSYLEFYEVDFLIISLFLLFIIFESLLIYIKYGFARRRTTGNVDTNYVYAGGRHLIGPDFQFKIFYGAGQFVRYNHIPIFTLDNLEVFKFD